MLIRPLQISDRDALSRLAEEAASEDFHFVTRFLTHLATGRSVLDSAQEFFLGAFASSAPFDLIAIGGVTPDPYGAPPSVGRLRHLFVRSSHRRTGIGRLLVCALEQRAATTYERLRLRTDTPAASRFYEMLGYAPTTECNATHARELSRSHDVRAIDFA